MGFLNRLFGGVDDEHTPATGPTRRLDQPPQRRPLTDEQAIERYRYLVQTAPPEAIEQAHEEAFAQLTPQQRAMVLQQLATNLPSQERSALERGGDDPRTLARAATRAELRQPGTMERMFYSPASAGFGGMGGMGMAGLGTTLFGSLAAGFVGSMIANGIYDSLIQDNDMGFDGGAADASGDMGGTEVSNEGDFADPGMDLGGDFGGDLGGGDFGGDFGGGDF
jgi:hypothetical protein